MDSELPTTFLSQSRFHQTCIRSRRVELFGAICMWGDAFYSLNLGNRSSTRKTQVRHSSCCRKVNSLWFFKSVFWRSRYILEKIQYQQQYLLKLEDLGRVWMCQTFLQKGTAWHHWVLQKDEGWSLGLEPQVMAVDGEQDKSQVGVFVWSKGTKQ